MSLPSKHLLSAFYKTLPSKNPSKNTLSLLKTPYRGFSSSVLLRQGLLEPAGREDPKREKERLGLEAVPNWAMERFMTNRLDEVGGPSGLKTALVLHSSLVLRVNKVRTL